MISEARPYTSLVPGRICRVMTRMTTGTIEIEVVSIYDTGLTCYITEDNQNYYTGKAAFFPWNAIYGITWDADVPVKE